MRGFKQAVLYLVVVFVALSAVIAQADVFNMGTGLTSLKMVPVGNPGNTGEGSGESYGGYGPDRVCGAVSYNYQIGKYEVTAGQYTEFLNAVAKTDLYGLYSVFMDTAHNQSYHGCNINRSGNDDGSYTYSVAADYANWPVNFVSFWDAARFTNWLHNGQGNGDTETGAYTLNGFKGPWAGPSISRNAGAKWFLPSEDEWYKAAYHKNDGVTANYWDYPTSTNTVPFSDNPASLNFPANSANYYNTDGLTNGVNDGYAVPNPYLTNAGAYGQSLSPYGTLDQGGNVWEWTEAIVYDGSSTSSRGLRGGSWHYESYNLYAAYRHMVYGFPSGEDCYFGFRVASVPEPGSLMLVLVGGVCLLTYTWRRRRAI